jgi:hypothetical protein
MSAWMFPLLRDRKKKSCRLYRGICWERVRIKQNIQKLKTKENKDINQQIKTFEAEVGVIPCRCSRQAFFVLSLLHAV